MIFPPHPPAEQSKAYARYTQLTMPPGALDALFAPLLRILAVESTRLPTPPFACNLAALLFAGDHEVAKTNPVSAFPCEVTAQMVLNFMSGGAATIRSATSHWTSTTMRSGGALASRKWRRMADVTW